MKRILSIFLLIASLPTFACTDPSSMLDKITMKLSAEQWVTTNTANVFVTVNAAVTDKDVANLQDSVMKKLEELATGTWHITSFNRSKDQSGLESLTLTAEARLPQPALSGLRDKATSISKPGQTYTISDIQFSPSDDELRTAEMGLRREIYSQVKDELSVLNKTYAPQQFRVYQVNFVSDGVNASAQNKMATMSAFAMPQPAPMNVGGKDTLSALVVFASAQTGSAVQLIVAHR